MATKFNAKPRGELLAPPNYNAAPQDWHPVTRLNDDGAREILNMRWGFLSKEAKTEKSVKTPINARAESILIAEGPLQNQDGVIHVKAVRPRSMFDQTLEVHSHVFHQWRNAGWGHSP